MTKHGQRQRIAIQILSDERVKGRQCSIPGPEKCLSALDQTCLTYGSFGGQVLFKDSIVAPLLKRAFAQTLSELPWFAGRLYFRKDDRTYDVDCNNAGGRIIFASTDATLEELAEALLPTSKPVGGAFDPAVKYALPRDVDVIAKKELPLCLVYLLHLSGGGGLLVVTAWHGLVDFTGLQTFVDHLAAAYNTALAERQRGCVDPDHHLAAESTLTGTSTSTTISAGITSSTAISSVVDNSSISAVSNSTTATSATSVADRSTGSVANGGTTASSALALDSLSAVADVTSAAACTGLPPSPPPCRRRRRRGFYAPDAVDQLAESAPPPPPAAGARRWPSVTSVPAWRTPLVLSNILYQMFLRGGGLEDRYLWVSAQRLADLKRRATEELNTAAAGAAAGAKAAKEGCAVSPAPPSGPTDGAGGVARAAGVDSAAGCCADVSAENRNDALPKRPVDSQPACSIIGVTASITSSEGIGVGGVAPSLGRPATSSTDGRNHPGGHKTADQVPGPASSAAAAGPTTPLDTPPCAWVSSRDCLAARLAQLLHSVPLKNHPDWHFFIVANLRPRSVPRLPDGQLGNWMWGAMVDEVAPCRMRLGELAARVRAALNRLPAMLGAHVRTVRKLAKACPPWQLMNEVILEADPKVCLVAPEGPVAFNNWQLEYDIWQFGPAPPLIFKPALPAEIIPNLITTFASPTSSSSRPASGPDRGLILHVCLHRAVWRHLDAATGGDLLAALYTGGNRVMQLYQPTTP